MIFRKPRRWVNRVFIHCSASDQAAHDNVATMRKWHTDPKPRGRGWSDVGYHFFIRKNGLLETGRPLERVPAAQLNHNRGTIAICLHGLDINRFTEAQFRTLRSLCTAINDAYGGAVTFHGHREVAAKSCPVFDYQRVLGLDAAGRLGLAGMTTALADMPAPDVDPADEGEENIKPAFRSTTVQAAVGTGTAVTTGAVAISQNVQALSSTQIGLLVLCGLVVAGGLFWIWRERRRRGREFGF